MVIFAGGKFRDYVIKVTVHFTWGKFSRYYSYFLHKGTWVLFSHGGNFRAGHKSAKNAKITPTRKFPRLQYAICCKPFHQMDRIHSQSQHRLLHCDQRWHVGMGSCHGYTRPSGSTNTLASCPCQFCVRMDSLWCYRFLAEICQIKFSSF